MKGQTASVFWAVNITNGNTWGAVTIGRNQEKSNLNIQNLIKRVRTTATKEILLQGRAADMDLIVEGTATVFNVTFTLQNLIQTDEMYYNILVQTDQFQTSTEYTSLRVMGEYWLI